MRTLKKTLALVLVLAMVFSLCITASADFTDADEIKNVKAVNTLVALGVIEGMPDGSFGATGTLTRAQAAAIICRLLGIDAYIEQCATPFTDVAESHWASGYIAYCADAGIINGYGDGKFGPSDELTGYAWAKMLLVAGNMVPTNEKGEPTISLTGSAWQINVARLAVANGLWVGDDSSKKEAVSRDNACLHAFNAIDYPVAETVVYDAFGAPVAVEWSIEVEGEKEPVIVDSVAVEPVLTYADGVKAADIVKDLGYAEKDAAKANLGGFESAGKGEFVRVFATAEEDVYAVFTTVYYAAEITKVVEAKDDAKAYVEFAGYTYETEDFAEGDYVIYTVADGKLASVEAAETKTVKVTAKGAGYVKAGADKYEPAAGTVLGVAVGAEKVFVFDSFGYVKMVADVKVDAPVVDTTETVVYVVDHFSITVPGVPAEYDEYGRLVEGTGTADTVETYAQVVTLEGEVENLLVAAAGDEDCLKAITVDAKTGIYTMAAPEKTLIVENFVPVEGKLNIGGLYYDKAEYVSILGSLDKIAVGEGTLKAAAADGNAYAIYTVDKTGHKSVALVIYWAEKAPEAPKPGPTYDYALLATGAAYTEESSVMQKVDDKEVAVAVYEYVVYINGEKTTIKAYTDAIAADFYEYYVDEYGVYVLSELDGFQAKVDYVYGQYITVGEYVDYDITGIEVVDLTEKGNGTIEAGETIALFAVENTDGTYEIACIYITESVVAE